MPETIVLVAFLFLFFAVGWAIGASRGRPFAGLVLGVILGPVGWCVALFLPRPYERRYYRRGR